MDYFSKFLKTGNQPPPKPAVDHAQEFHKSWRYIEDTLLHPDERQLSKGINATDVSPHLQSMVDSLVWESNRTEEGDTGACLEYLLKNDVLGTLVRLSESDRPSGIQAEVLRAVQNMVVLLDEQFLVHSAVHRAVLRLLRNCVGDDLQEQLDGRNKVMGAARNSARGQPSEYEEDLVNLLCILCSRIRTHRELLMIFFHDKHWYRSEPLFSLEEGDEDEDDEDSDDASRIVEGGEDILTESPESPTPSQATLKYLPDAPSTKKPEYEFLLFNYLLRFVHREGQIGNFARAGLLFLMDVAMSPGEPTNSTPPSSTPNIEAHPDPITDAALALAEYILDGDFSEVLGAGLGAVYSLLPSKLEFHVIVSAAALPSNGMVIGGIAPETEEDKEMAEFSKERARALGVEDASNPDFRSRLDHFLKLLEFLQDVLRRNVPQESMDPSTLVGTAIVQSILAAVRRIFLENVLYPTVLECSDLDGSAVAVMSYIEVMIRTLQHGPLSGLLVDFLMGDDNEGFQARPRSRLTLTLGAVVPSSGSTAGGREAKLRRRKSSAMALLEMEAPDSRKPTEYFTSMGRFTLKDLVLTNLRSPSQASATCALHLLQSLLIHHSHVTIDRLLIVIPDSTATSFPHPALFSQPQLGSAVPKMGQNEEDDDAFRYPEPEPEPLNDDDTTPLFIQPETTLSTHEREMGLYLTLVSRVDPAHNGDPFSTGYDHYLRDALLSIQSQPAFQLGLDVGDVDSAKGSGHRLNVNDPIITLVLDSLRKFFSNTPELNIALTGVLATLAVHPNRSLGGWLTFSSPEPSFGESAKGAGRESTLEADDDRDDRSIDFTIEEKLASESNVLPAAALNEKSRPIIHTIFQGLVAQLDKYRSTIDDFDKFLIERRQGLLFSENLTDALTLAINITEDMATAQAPIEPPSRPKPKAKNSFVSFLTPKKAKPTKSPLPAEPHTPPRSGSKSVTASPFGSHYQHTSSVVVEPFIAPLPSDGPWTPAKSKKWNADEEDVFSSGWGGSSTSTSVDENAGEKQGNVVHITLSQLLDNVVILEESIKELVAIIHARRSLGIDSIRYL